MIEPQIESEQFLSLLEKLMRTPTAPFREHEVRALLISEAQKIPMVSITQDEWGNVLVSYAARTKSDSWVFCAHMDHPGFVDGEFRGSIRPEYLNRNHGVTQFGAGIGMWAVPPFERTDGWIKSCACDDLVGCAVALETVFQHARAETHYNVHALFTVAEEVGLFGAALACQSQLIPPHATVISLETSPALSERQFKSGCIVRVGDKRTIFTPAVTRTLLDAAISAGIPHQRCLMDGGTCEASIFYKAGYNTGALCVALGNPHNQHPQGRIDAEYVSETDVIHMLKLATLAPTITATDWLSGTESVEAIAERARAEFRQSRQKKATHKTL
jgi:endoglucanase